MTVSAVFPTPLPQDGRNGSGEHPDPEPHADPRTGWPPEMVVAVEPLTISEVYKYFLEHRAAVHEALQEHRAAGTVVNVPFDAVFLCELAGLVVDLETGLVDALANGHVAPIAALRNRLAGLGFVTDGEGDGVTVDGVAKPA